MEVSKISIFNNKRYAFKGQREDLKNVSVLSNGEMPITPNKKQNILASLNNIAADPTEANLAFLLDTADSLAYGLKKNSSMARLLNEMSRIPEEKENTNWDELLEATIKRGLESSSSPKKEELNAKYQKVFNENRSLNDNEKQVMDLRLEILDSEELRNSVEDTETLLQTTRIAQNLDYFIASSEISMKQKIECLEKMKYFLSDDYKIEPQIADKKVQVLDEMLNDMLIKTPASPVLTIKEVNQRQTGMCAAISKCRKALAYEDKSNYMDVLMAELDAKPTMEVYDVTKLDEGVKIPIKKTYIDYNDAIRKGYRIIDTAAHQWMHLAGSTGDGSTFYQTYTPFDRENYEIFQDSFWYEDLPGEYKPAQDTLRFLIKEREAINEIEKTKKAKVKIDRTIGEEKNSYILSVEKSSAKLLDTIREIAPELTSTQSRILTKGILNLQKTKDPDTKIKSNEGKNTQQGKIAKYIKSQAPSVSDEKIAAKMDTIYAMFQEYTAADSALAKLNAHNKPRAKFSYYNKLFKLAAINRQTVKAELSIPGRAEQYEQLLGIEPHSQQIIKQLNKLDKNLNSPQQISKLAEQFGTANDKESVSLAINKSKTEIEVDIPMQLDNILNRMSMGSTQEVLVSFLENTKQNIIEGNTSALDKYAATLHIKNDEKTVLNSINSLIQQLKNNPNNKNINEVARLLGFADQIQLVVSMYNVFVNMLNSGTVDEASYQEIMKNLGNTKSINKAVNKLAHDINTTIKQYEAIEAKSGLPSKEEIITKRLENEGVILSSQSLDKLQAKFDKINDEKIKREKDKNKGLKVRENNDDLYKFTPEEIALFKQIDDGFGKTKKYANLQYKKLNHYLAPQLEKLYADTGRLSGNFWLHEEGNSGLASNQSVRIFEQMTGRPYYVENNLDTMVQKIKEGNGSGTSTTSVMNSEYAMHAQYVPEISSVELIDEKTKEKVVKDVLWHDNSWGKGEAEGKWLGEDGLYHTDYDSGYGGKEGYILGADFKTGTFVSDLNTEYGVLKGTKERFPLFFKIVMPGNAQNTYQKLNELFNYIFSVKETPKTLEKLESKIKSGEEVNTKELEAIDERCEQIGTKLNKRILEEITSKEEYEAIADNDLLKFMVAKLALYESTNNEEIKEAVLCTLDQKTLDELKAELPNVQKAYINAFFNKSADVLKYIQVYSAPFLQKEIDVLQNEYQIDAESLKEIYKNIFNINEEDLDGTLKGLKNILHNNVISAVNSNIKDKQTAQKAIKDITTILDKTLKINIAINSIDDAKDTMPEMADTIIKWIDKIYNPRTDEELVKYMKQLQDMPKEEFNKLLDKMTDEDMGIVKKDPYEYVLQLQGQNERISEDFTSLINSFAIMSGFTSLEDESTEVLYRDLYLKLSDLDVDKYISKFKAEAFSKYQVRSAFPKIQVLQDDVIVNLTRENIANFAENINTINSQKKMIKILQQISFVSSYNFGENDKNSLKELSEAVKSLYALTKDDSSMDYVNNCSKNMMILLKDYINGGADTAELKQVQEDLASMNSALESNGLTTENLIKENKAIKDGLNEVMDLFVEANVIPRYTDEAKSQLKILAKEIINNPESQAEIDAYNKLVNTLVSKHITKSPIELLHLWVEQIQSDTPDEELEAVYKSYLEAALQTANLAKVEYKLVKNEHAGIASKTRDILENCSVTGIDGKQYSMDSDEGIMYLIQQLASENNNNSTMNLFLTQTGLNENALRVLMKYNKPTELIKGIKELERLIITTASDTITIGNAFEDFAKYNNIKYNTFKDAANHLLNKTDSYFADKSDAELETYNLYKTYISKTADTEVGKSIKGNDVMPNLIELHNLTMQKLLEHLNQLLEELNSVGEIVEEKLKLINGINVAESSKYFNEREIFNSKYEKVTALWQTVLNRTNQQLDEMGMIEQ